MKPIVLLSGLGLVALATIPNAGAYPSWRVRHGGEEFRAVNSPTTDDYKYVYYSGDKRGATSSRSQDVKVIAAPIRESLPPPYTTCPEGNIRVNLWHTTSVQTTCQARIKNINGTSVFSQSLSTSTASGAQELVWPVTWTDYDDLYYPVVVCTLKGANKAIVLNVSTYTGNPCTS